MGDYLIGEMKSKMKFAAKMANFPIKLGLKTF